MIPIFPFVGYSQENINLYQKKATGCYNPKNKIDKNNATENFKSSQSKGNKLPYKVRTK